MHAGTTVPLGSSRTRGRALFRPNPTAHLAGVQERFLLSYLSTSLRRVRSRSAGLAIGVLAGLGTTVLVAAPASAATGDPFAALRQCESGGDYGIDTGNGYYGAYQFDVATWRGLGQTGLPSSASPETQDAAARALQAQRGWAPWPGCSAKLGLAGYTVTAPVPPPAAPAAVAPAARSAAPSAPSRSHVRAASSHAVFTVALVGQVREDVRAWQQQMVALGHPLVVDGQYGAQSARATHDFEVQHGLSVESPGIVGPQVRAAMADALAG